MGGHYMALKEELELKRKEHMKMLLDSCRRRELSDADFWTWKDTNKLVAFYVSHSAVCNPTISNDGVTFNGSNKFYAFTEPYPVKAHLERVKQLEINLYLIDMDRIANDGLYITASTSDELLVVDFGTIFKYTRSIDTFAKVEFGQYVVTRQDVLDKYFQNVGAFKLPMLYTLIDFNFKEGNISIHEESMFDGLQEFKDRMYTSMVNSEAYTHIGAKSIISGIPDEIYNVMMEDAKSVYNTLKSI